MIEALDVVGCKGRRPVRGGGWAKTPGSLSI